MTLLAQPAWYWAVLALAALILYGVGRAILSESKRTRRFATVQQIRHARTVEDFHWQHGRVEALRACMHITVRRASREKLAELGFVLDDAEAVV